MRGSALAGFPASLNHSPHARGRKRKLARLDAEGSERGGDRVRERAGDRDDAAFARALGAERIRWRGVLLKRDRGNLRIIGGKRDHIIGERADEQLTVLVVSDLFAEYAAKPLHGG